jgi:predicted nucleic acid-binding protein
MILLDTNVISELVRQSPEPGVTDWLVRYPPASLFLSAISEAELRLGVMLLPAGKRRDALSGAVAILIEQKFRGQILPFDSSAAAAFAEIVATRRRAGRPVSVADAQIAAIARSRGALVATRNVDDFAGAGIGVINPWEPGHQA